MFIGGELLCNKCRNAIQAGERFLERKGNKGKKLHFCGHDCFYEFHKKLPMTLKQKQDFEQYSKWYWKHRLGSRLVLPGDMKFITPEAKK